ncbi:MAG: flagellar hook-basal body protein [Planctomycetota bacterium]
MISGLYSVATAMDASTKRHEVAAENLAKAQMPGYRRQVLANSTFDTVMRPLPPAAAGSYTSKLLGTTTSPVIHDFSQGVMDQTGRPLDIAMTGDGFLTVEGPSGALYTRNGSLYVNEQRQLVTVDNLPVRGTAGPIVVPVGISSEAIQISRDGRLSAQGVEFAQFELVSFPDNNALTPAGLTLFSAPNTMVPVATNAEILQGHLERGSTSTVDEMINLVTASRHFDAAQRALTSIGEALQKRIGLR